MAKIGQRTSLTILREQSFGLFLDGGELGEVLLPHREVPRGNVIGEPIEVFLYTDSEDRPVATTRTPLAMPGEFARLKCVASTQFGAFLDWGLAKDLLVPFGEQKVSMQIGKHYLVHVHVDPVSDRIVASSRITRHLSSEGHDYRPGQAVDLIIYGKTELGYNAIINGRHGGLLFGEGVFQPLRTGEKIRGYIAAVREDGKIDLSLHAQRGQRVGSLEEQILAELEARGGFWPIGDHSSAAEIHDELGVSKRTFKQAVGSLFKKQQIQLEKGKGIRLSSAD